MSRPEFADKIPISVGNVVRTNFSEEDRYVVLGVEPALCLGKLATGEEGEVKIALPGTYPYEYEEAVEVVGHFSVEKTIEGLIASHKTDSAEQRINLREELLDQRSKPPRLVSKLDY